jgi:hypothetical protein
MSPEIIEIVLLLTFLGICCLVGEILVQCRRDRAAQDRFELSASWNEGPHGAQKDRLTRGQLPAQHLSGAGAKQRQSYGD